jgi:hypothetical protein
MSNTYTMNALLSNVNNNGEEVHGGVRSRTGRLHGHEVTTPDGQRLFLREATKPVT